MGFKYVEAALQAAIPKTEGIDTGVVKAVLVAICQHADNTTGQCFPAIDRLARMCQHSQSSVSRAVDVLNSLKVFTHYRKGDGHICSRYAVDLKRLESWAIDWKDPSKILGTLGSQQEPWVPTRSPDFPRGTLGSQLAPNQSLNLSLNLSPVQSVKHSLASLAPPPAAAPTTGPTKAKSKATPTPQEFVSKAKPEQPLAKAAAADTWQSDDPRKPLYVRPL